MCASAVPKSKQSPLGKVRTSLQMEESFDWASLDEIETWQRVKEKYKNLVARKADKDDGFLSTEEFFSLLREWK